MLVYCLMATLLCIFARSLVELRAVSLGVETFYFNKIFYFIFISHVITIAIHPRTSHAIVDSIPNDGPNDGRKERSYWVWRI